MGVAASLSIMVTRALTDLLPLSATMRCGCRPLSSAGRFAAALHSQSIRRPSKGMPEASSCMQRSQSGPCPQTDGPLQTAPSPTCTGTVLKAQQPSPGLAVKTLAVAHAVVEWLTLHAGRPSKVTRNAATALASPQLLETCCCYSCLCSGHARPAETHSKHARKHDSPRLLSVQAACSKLGFACRCYLRSYTMSCSRCRSLALSMRDSM